MTTLSPVVVKQMIRAITAPLEGDGASVDVVGVADDVVKLEYRQGTCEECVMHPDDLAAIVLEAIHAQLPEVRQIEVVEVA